MLKILHDLVHYSTIIPKVLETWSHVGFFVSTLATFKVWYRDILFKGLMGLVEGVRC